MKKIRSFLAVILAVLMLLPVAPAIASATETGAATDSIASIGQIFTDFFKALSDFINAIVEFFSNLGKPAVKVVAVESVDVEAEKVTVTLGDTIAAVAVVTPANATNQALWWTSANEAVAAFDGNGNIIAAGRGRTTITVASVEDPTKVDTFEIEVRDPEAKYVTDVQSINDAMISCERGESVVVVLDSDIILDANAPLQYNRYMFIANGRNVTFDLNGYNIILEEDSLMKDCAIFTTANKGTLNIVGEGTVEVKNGKTGIFLAMNAETYINIYGGTYISNSDNGSDGLAIIYTNSGSVNVYGGKFITPEGVPSANAEDIHGTRLCTMFYEGVLLNQNKYFAGSDGANRILLEEGCELQPVEIDGEIWYQVTKIA